MQLQLYNCNYNRTTTMTTEAPSRAATMGSASSEGAVPDVDPNSVGIVWSIKP